MHIFSGETEILFLFFLDKTAASKSLLTVISSPYPSPDPAAPHPIDLPHTSRLYKTLLQGGHFNHNTKSIERAPGWDARVFAEAFVDVVGEQVGVAMCIKGQRDGAFVIAELCEAFMRQENEGTKTARIKVKQWFGPAILKEIEKGDAKGKRVLLEKIALL